MNIRDHILRGQRDQESNIGRSLGLEKGGKRAQIGEVRTWSGVKYIKTKDDWVNLAKHEGGLVKKTQEIVKKEKSTESKFEGIKIGDRVTISNYTKYDSTGDTTTAGKVTAIMRSGRIQIQVGKGEATVEPKDVKVFLRPIVIDLKKHPMWSETDHKYLSEKGYDKKEIKAIWDRDHKAGKSPVSHDQDVPDVVGKVQKLIQKEKDVDKNYKKLRGLEEDIKNARKDGASSEEIERLSERKLKLKKIVYNNADGTSSKYGHPHPETDIQKIFREENEKKIKEKQHLMFNEEEKYLKNSSR